MTYLTSTEVLNAVERWADGFVMLRETSAVFGTDCAYGSCRCDAVLVPLSWEAKTYDALGFKQGLAAVEVKVSRADFQHGLKRGQFETYAGVVSGLYLATVQDIKTREIPPEYGHIVVVQRGDVFTAVCKRHPKFVARQLEQAQLWRILWAMAKWHIRNREEERRTLMRLKDKYKEAFGGILGRVEQEIRRKEREHAAAISNL